jgi:uncharacterized membrane protein
MWILACFVKGFLAIFKSNSTGLFILLTVVLTIYLLYWLAVSAEQILGGYYSGLFLGLFIS